jgi:hypothetical protein
MNSDTFNKFGLRFLGLKTINLKIEIALNLCLGLFHKILSKPGVIFTII